MARRKAQPAGFEVARKQCKTCIFRKELNWNLQALLDEIADPHMPGHFAGFRICHDRKRACCRGFWERHKDDFQAGQLAQRLGCVIFVDNK